MAKSGSKPRNNAGKVNVTKGSGQMAAAPGSFTAVGDTPSNKLPTTRPAGSPGAAMTTAKPGNLKQNRSAPGTMSEQQASTQVQHNDAG